MSADPSELLRALPPIHQVIGEPRLAAMIDGHGRGAVVQWVRETLDDVRERLTTTGRLLDRTDLIEQVLDEVLACARRQTSARLGRVVNATGVVLHTSLGRAPLAAAAVERLAEVAAGTNLEIDLETGERRRRGYQLQEAFHTLTGAEAALVVNNNAAATILVLQSLCAGREVILSRGQLIEIGGSFRLPEIFSVSGARLREVGTTNRTTLDDYIRAISPDTAAILRVHPSNYRVIGFSDTPEIDELAALCRERGILCLDDIGSGSLVDVTRWGLPAEPTFQTSLAAGADLVLGSGDKLLGGPQCGIILGGAVAIAQLQGSPLARAVRVDKLTLGALAATLDLYLRGSAEQDVPTLALLTATAEALQARAEAIAGSLITIEGCTAEVLRTTSLVGGGSLPGVELPTAAVALTPHNRTADALAQALRLGSPRVFGRISQGRVLLDLRSVQPADDAGLVEALRSLTRV